MNRKRDLIGLLTLIAVWAVWPTNDDTWFDPLSGAEDARCEGKGSGGVRWRMHNDGDCGGVHRILTVKTGQGHELTATVIRGQILMNRWSDPPRFRIIQPILYDSSSHYPYGRPGTWTAEYSPEGYHWK